jgi:predicted nucleotidyltransferase
MMEAEIKNKLKDLEAQHKVKILYACETGSRAWGFPSPDSDYDVRMIYVHEPDWYLSLQEGKSTIELMANDGDLDITGWDLRMCLRLLWKSNASMLERVQSPIVYMEQEGIVSQFREHAEKCFSPIATMHHYLGMAHTSFEDVENHEMVKLKKLFYALRAALACKWIIDKESAPPIVFMTMVDELSFDEALKDRIKQLIVLKSGKNENYVHPMETALNQFIKLQLEHGKAQANHLKGRKDNDVDLDLFFRNVLKIYGYEHK